MDKIIIKGAKLHCNIGVSEGERKKKQDIFVDAELLFNFKNASLTDDIKKTVDYSGVCRLMENIAMKKEYKLIETLAEEIAAGILSKYPIKKITVRVKKPLSYAKYAAAEITRKNG